jgi:hypothetical protein
MTDDKIVESNIKNERSGTDETRAESDPAKVKALDSQLMPWAAAAGFKTLHVCYIMQEENGGPVTTEAIAKELNMGEERVAALLRLARTVVSNPMPMAFSRACLMFEQLSNTLHDIKNESSDDDAVRLATETLGRVESMEPSSNGFSPRAEE